MKTFRASLVIFLLLIGSVIALSTVGRSRLSVYRESIPAEDAALSDAADALSALSARLDDERLLLALLFSHERCDDLKSTVTRCAAAARAEEYAEYAILRAELLGLIEAMERDLKPGILDVL